MAQTDFILDDTMVGTVLPVADGYLTDLRRTQSPVDQPALCAPDGTWLSGKFQIRGENDIRDLICTDSLDVGSWSGGVKTLIANSSLPYKGGLVIRALPKGAVFSLTLSDAPIQRTGGGTAPTARRAAALIDAATAPV
jgi:hypothetical protein